MIKVNLPEFCSGFWNQSGEYSWQRGLCFILLVPGLVICELMLTAAVNGYMPNQVNFLLRDNIDFLLLYFRDEPLDSLKFVFFDQPLLVIESRQENTLAAIWGLHYFSYTVAVHLLVAMVLTQVIIPSQPRQAGSRYLLIAGSVLLVVSSLYLYLSSCCTSGANWILHTWLLALVFNPLTATDFIIEVYNVVYNWFTWIQLLMAMLGAYVVFRGLKGNVTV